MEDLLKKYGGLANLKKHLNFFYKKVCEEKNIKHYFFGINVDNVINDAVNYRSFILRKPDHLYRDFPAQTSPASIKVKIPVFEDVVKVLQLQMQNGMIVNWRDVPRYSHHVMDAIEETRCKSMDSDAPMSIRADLVNMQAIEEILTDRKRQVRTEMQENGDLKLDRSWQIVYPFFLRLSTEAKTITLIGKGYGREGVAKEEIIKVAEAAKKKFPFFEFPIKQDANGTYIEMTHVSDYSADGVPIRLFLTMLLNFGWRFDEVMALDKDQQMINVVRDKV
jgi:hypothetical protein